MDSRTKLIGCSTHIRIIAFSYSFTNNTLHIVCRHVYNLRAYPISHAHIQWSTVITNRDLTKHLSCRHLAMSHSYQMMHISPRSTAAHRISVCTCGYGSHPRSSRVLHILIAFVTVGHVVQQFKCYRQTDRHSTTMAVLAVHTVQRYPFHKASTVPVTLPHCLRVHCFIC
jgi:hypothetical protein